MSRPTAPRAGKPAAPPPPWAGGPGRPPPPRGPGGGGAPPPHSPVAHARRPQVARDSQTLGLDRQETVRFLAAAQAASARDHALAGLLTPNGLRVSDPARPRPPPVGPGPPTGPGPWS